MNPRQRRGALLLGLAVVGAAAVFMSVTSYVADVRSQVGPVRSVLELTIQVERFQPITESAYEVVEVPERFVPSGALSVEQLIGKVAAARLPAGTVLQDGVVTDPPVLGGDVQQIAITVGAETGVAGQIGPGSRVDIFATFEGEEDGATPRDCEVLLIHSALVLSTGDIAQQADDDGPSGQVITEEVVPVTFALPSRFVAQLVYAESFAKEVRLVRLGPEAGAPVPEATEAEGGERTKDPVLGNCVKPAGLAFPRVRPTEGGE